VPAPLLRHVHEEHREGDRPHRAGRQGPRVTRTSHKGAFTAEGTAREAFCKAQALSGDIPGVDPDCGKVCPPPTTHSHPHSDSQDEMPCQPVYCPIRCEKKCRELALLILKGKSP
jgi:hypothetical protein